MKRDTTHRKSKQTRAATRPAAPAARPTVACGSAPPLAELRRRATDRLRKVSLALAALDRERAEAAAECERLAAALPHSTTDLKRPQSTAPVPELAAARTQADRLEATVKEVSARLASPIQRPQSQGAETSGEGRARMAELQAELKKAVADNATLREDMARLVRFLDELTEVLQGSPGDRT